MKIAKLKIYEGVVRGGASGEHTQIPKGNAKQIRGTVIEANMSYGFRCSLELLLHNSKVKYVLAKEGGVPRIDIGEKVIIHLEYHSSETVAAVQIIRDNQAIFRVIFSEEEFRNGSHHYHFG